MKTINIAVISASDATSKMLCSQLTSLLGKYMNFHPFAVQEWSGESNMDLVLFSSHILFTRYSPFLSRSKNEMMIIRRTITKAGWDQIRHLPAGSQHFIVNDERDSVVETISLLYESGLRQVDLVPYYPGIPDNTAIQSAITPGEPQLVPPYVKQIIDIGPRVVDTTTVMEIVTRLNLLNHETRTLINEYAEQIVTLSQGLQITIQGLIEAKNLFEETLNMVQDGVITYDGHGNITFINRTALEIFNRSVWEEAGQTIEHFFDKHGLDRMLLHDDEEVKDRLVTFRKQTLILNKMQILGRGGHSERVLILKIAKKVEELEMKLRAQLTANGHAAKFTFNDIRTGSDTMIRLIGRAQKMAKNDLSVLLLGENGTGKELFAHSIHHHSLRAAYPFIPVNCSALSENLLESELFGYEEGAFTGARKGGKLGLFEQAHKGTIFLDEIGDISRNLQTRLLRVIQQKEVLKVGGTRVLPVDVRVISATNRDLQKMVNEGQFREDLFYRLKVLQLDIPPLRERREDVPLLVHYFLERRSYPYQLSADIMEAFRRYSWPGNIRELENAAEYLTIMSDGDMTIDELPFMTDKLQRELKADAADSETIEGEAVTNKQKFSPREGAVPAGLLELHMEPFLLRLMLDVQSSGGHTGRRNLIVAARHKGVVLTENEMRKWICLLRDRKLIEVRIGRSGCSLTPEGYRYLQTAEQ